MDFSNSMGGLIPLWILGAPLVIGLIALARMPKFVSREDRERRDGQAPSASASTGSTAGSRAGRL